MSVIARYIRWRHARGFGVHSPFAFRIVQEVLTNPYGFYAFHDIDITLEKERHPRPLQRKARMILRLANLIRPENVYLQPHIHPAFGTAIRAAVPRAHISRKINDATTADFIVTSEDYTDNPSLHKAINSVGKTVVLLNQPKQSILSLRKDFKIGLILYDLRDAIVFPRQSMNRIEYSIIL